MKNLNIYIPYLLNVQIIDFNENHPETCQIINTYKISIYNVEFNTNKKIFEVTSIS